MKIFAYHNGNNGVSQYRIWGPVKYLNRIEGIEAKRLPDMTERFQIPLEGATNVPGILSVGDVFRSNDCIWDVYRADFDNSIRFCALAERKPHVLDIDDDFLHIDKMNPNAKSWQSKVKARMEEIELGKYTEAEIESKCKQLNAKVCFKDGRRFMVSLGYDPVENALNMVKAAAGITVSTETLKEVFEPFNNNIFVNPNAIDFEEWGEKKKMDDGVIRLGLFGSNTHYHDWKLIAGILKEILDEFPNVHLCFNTWLTATFEQGANFNELQERHARFPDYFHELGLIERASQVEIYEPCQIQDWPAWMAGKGVDIGLAPLVDTRFNDAKSNLKYLEFSALRVPGVYSDVRAYNRDIKNGVNGFLSKNADEWGKKIRALIKDETLRRQMGNRAWMDVKNRYDQAETAKRLAAFFKSIEGGKRNEKCYSDRIVTAR